MSSKSAPVIEPAQILGLIQSLSQAGNKSVELQRLINGFVSVAALERMRAVFGLGFMQR